MSDQLTQHQVTQVLVINCWNRIRCLALLKLGLTKQLKKHLYYSLDNWVHFRE